MVRLRLKRMGRRHRPFYRLNAVEKRTQRDGKVLEQLGWYDPLAKDNDHMYSLNAERIKYWLGVGAQPSDTVMDILTRNDIVAGDAWKATREGRLVKKRAAIIQDKQAAEAAARAEAEAKAKEEAEAAAKAAAEAEAAKADEEQAEAPAEA